MSYTIESNRGSSMPFRVIHKKKKDEGTGNGVKLFPVFFFFCSGKNLVMIYWYCICGMVCNSSVNSVQLRNYRGGYSL